MEPTKLYEISVDGCGDSTTIEMELTQVEYELVQKVANAITNASTYGCMPRMSINLKA